MILFIITELLILTKQKLRRNSDIFNGNTPLPLLTKRKESQCYPPLSKRGQGVLSNIYPWKNEIIVYSRIYVNPLLLVVGS